MNKEACERALIRKITQQGCSYEPIENTPFSMFFKDEQSGKYFSMPRPSEDGWTQTQLEFMHEALEYRGLELLPLDYN